MREGGGGGNRAFTVSVSTIAEGRHGQTKNRRPFSRGVCLILHGVRLGRVGVYSYFSTVNTLSQKFTISADICSDFLSFQLKDSFAS